MRHLIIGASAAGITAAKTIRQWEPDDEITSRQALPERASTQIRFGTAISALQISEKFHTVSREQMHPRKAVSP